MRDPRIRRAFALTIKSFQAWRSPEERAEFRNEAWEILSTIYLD